jgi:hypothetical protein
VNAQHVIPSSRSINMTSQKIRRGVVAALFALALNAAQAQSEASALSALSGLPIAVSLTAPALLLSAGTVLTVVAVEASVAGTVWVLERASDGARVTLHVSAQAAGGLSVMAGMTVLVTAISAGWVLSAAGTAIAFIPNEIGAALLYNERITR